MNYMGSKSKYAKYIVPILQKTIDDNGVICYCEPFCLSKDQFVYTPTGIKTIQDLQIGDIIYDDNGEKAQIINKQKTNNNKGKKITLKGNVILKATDNHVFYTVDGKEIQVKDLQIKQELLTGFSTNNTNQSIDLAKYITISNNPLFGRSGKVFDNNTVKLYHNAPIVPRFIEITPELMHCYGLIIAEGDKSNITMHKNELPYLEEFIKNYEHILNIDTSKNKKYYIENNSVQLAVPYKTIYEKLFFQAMNIGYGARNKNISFLFHCSPELCLEAIRYMIIGDGSIIHKGKYRSINYKTSSQTLAHQLQTLLSIKFHIKSTLSHGFNSIRQIEGRTLSPTDYYNISITKDEDITFLLDEKNTINLEKQKQKKFYITNIESIEDEFYDITIDNQSHCFILDGGIVTHNCGGANIIDKIKCEHKLAYDRSDTLIALLSAAANNMEGIPLECNRAMWDEGKAYVKDGKPLTTMTLAEVGAVEFFASYCKGGFPRGMANNTASRNYYMEGYRSLEKQASDLKGIEFAVANYWELNSNISGYVIYNDPPYQGTKQYAYTRQGKMDYEHFWNWVREMSKNNYVFTSEQQAPEDFEIIWEQEANRTTSINNKFKAIERLFRYKEGLK